MIAFAILLSAALFQFHGAPSPTPPDRTLRGWAAPDFELPAANGTTVRLSRLRGRAVLLNFWATWCAACRVEMPWLTDLSRRHAGEGLEIVGVSMDEAGGRSVQEFLRARPMAYPILLGGRTIASRYGGVRLLPQTFLIDRSGRVVNSLTGLGDRGDLEARVRGLLRPAPQTAPTPEAPRERR